MGHSRRLDSTSLFDLYELDIEGKHAFEEKVPPYPRQNENAKGDPEKSP